MQTINKGTNSFTNGMNMDTDVTMLANNLYRYAENVRLTTNDRGTSGVLQNIEGVKKYNTYFPSNEIVIGTSVVNEFGVVFTKVIDANGKYLYNRIYRADHFDIPTPVNHLVLQADLGLIADDSSHNLSIVANYETDSNIRVYFTDGVTSPKTLNIVSDKYTGFGPENPLLNEAGLLLDTSALDFTPASMLPPLNIDTQIVGNLIAGQIQYCYLLFNVHGTASVVSPLSLLTHLTSSNATEELMYYKGTALGNNSNKGCKLTANFISKDFLKCRVFSIHYVENTDTPLIRIVTEFDLSTDLISISATDTGADTMSTITIDLFNNMTGLLFTAMSFEKLDNRLFASNVLEATWNPEYDARSYRVNKKNELKLLSSTTLADIHIDASKLPETDVNDFYRQFFGSIDPTHDCINPYNTLDSSAVNDETDRYEFSLLTNEYGNKIRGGLGPNIDFNFMHTKFNLDYHPQSGYSTLGITPPLYGGLGSADSMILISDPYNSGNYVTEDFKTGTLRTYANPELSSKFRSYQRDEVYRFGIVFYNKKHIASPVKWIADIRMPHASDASPFKLNNDFLIGQPLGLLFHVRNIPEEAVAYEIVRCDRTELDRTVVCQVAVSLVGNNPDSDKNGGLGGDSDIRPYMIGSYHKGGLYSAAGLPMPNLPGRGSICGLGDGSVPADYVTMISPEISILGDSIASRISNASKLDTLYGVGTDLSGSRLYKNALKVRDTDSLNGELSKADKLGAMYVYDNTAKLIYVDDNSSAVCSGIVKYYLPFDSGYKGTNLTRISKKNVSIKLVKYPKIMPYNSLEDKSSYYTNIGNKSYINFAENNFDNTALESVSKYGPSGPCLIANIPGIYDKIPRFETVRYPYGNVNWDNSDNGYDYTYKSKATMLVANIKNNIVGYGGNTYNARQSSIYITTNSYVRAGDLRTYTFGGDTFLGILDHPVMMVGLWKDPEALDKNKMFSGAYIPFESSINIDLQHGDSINRSLRASDSFLDVFKQLEPGQLGAYHVQSVPYFAYNAAYSALQTSLKFISASIYAEDGVKTTNRIISSEVKTNNLVFDSWSQFKYANYLDVDNQYGSITNLKAFKNRLFFWQLSGLGVAAINERSLISDNNIGQLVLGTGGILTRADYITTMNGSSIINDRSIAASDGTLYWYDFNKNEICSYQLNVSQLSKEKGVLSYLHEMYTDKRKAPISLYDKKYNELLMKFYDKSLVFNELIGLFTSFYTFNPDWTLLFLDKIVAIKRNDYYRMNSIDIDGTSPINKISKLLFVVNGDSDLTKTFDNVKIEGVFVDPASGVNLALAFSKVATDIKFSTKRLTATPWLSIDRSQKYAIDYREDSYRFAIGRELQPSMPPIDTITNKSYAGRMKGKYLICDYTFDCNANRSFKLPYINTTYRYSLV